MTGSWSMGAGTRRARPRGRRRHGGPGRGAAAARIRASPSPSSKRATASGGRVWTDDRLGAPLDLGGSWVHGVDGNPLTLWCEKLGVGLVESQGDRLLIDKRATAPTREGQRRRAILGRAAFKTAIEWASWKSKAMARVWGPRSISVKQAVDPLLHAAWLPEIDRLVVGDLRRDERGRAGRALRGGLGRGMVSDRRAGPQRPAQGRLPAADRRTPRVASTSATARPCERLAWSGERRDAPSLQSGERLEADRAVDHRAARAVARRPACARSAAAGGSAASPSAGWATAPACWARSTCAFRGASGRSSRNGSGGCPMRPTGAAPSTPG